MLDVSHRQGVCLGVVSIHHIRWVERELCRGATRLDDCHGIVDIAHGNGDQSAAVIGAIRAGHGDVDGRVVVVHRGGEAEVGVIGAEHGRACKVGTDVERHAHRSAHLVELHAVGAEGDLVEPEDVVLAAE